MTRFGALSDTPATFALLDVRVIDPARGTDAVGNLAVLDGRLAAADALPESAPRVDGSGLIAAPGLYDLHSHLREPGTAGEDIASGARAAARGGFTTVCAMPNTDPALDEPERVARAADAATGAACRVRVVGAVTRGRGGEALTDLATLAGAGAVAFSDDGAALGSARLARAAMRELATLDRPLVEHAEDATLAAGTVMRAGATATRLGLAGWPPSAELTVVERDLALAAETGARLHLTHLSTAVALEAVRRARAAGVRVTCDVTPHHLALTDAWVTGSRRFSWEAEEPHAVVADLAYDGACRVNPPLPSRADALALLSAVADGTVDAIATDHAPHPPERTLVPFAEAAPGMIGLETALSLGLAAAQAGHLPLARLFAALSTGPASVLGEARSLSSGVLADVVVFDPSARWRVTPEALVSRSSNTPLLGMELPGMVRLTLAAGRVTWNDGLLGG